MTTRILIGAMECGEGEIEDSKEAAFSQRDVYGEIDWELSRFVVRDIPECEAHRRIYSEFKTSKNAYNYLLKVDGDMVLRPGALARMVRALKRQGGDCLLARVRDYFTRADIWGIWLYSQRCDWHWDRFLPRHGQPDKHLKDGLSYTKMENAVADHCYKATPLQAFRYGYNRVMRREHQQSHMRALVDHFALTRTPRLRYACLGALTACRKHPEPTHGNLEGLGTDYGDGLEETFQGALSEWSRVTDSYLARQLSHALFEVMP